MTKTECGRGHIYDSDIYSKCPYCNPESQPIIFGGESPSSISKTQPGSIAGDFGKIVTHIGPGNDSIGEISHTVAGSTVPGVTSAPEGIGKTTVGGSAVESGVQSGMRAVVGWIVCIDGPEKGKDYRLHAGNNNSIGRSPKMDVCIAKDDSVSREYQARIAYDEKYNQFTFVPGEKAGPNNYINGMAVYSPTRLEAYDSIEFGNSKFLFVPFCSDRFAWNKD